MFSSNNTGEHIQGYEVVVASPKGGKLKNGEPLVKGKRITAFTDTEEKDTTLDKYMPFPLETNFVS